MSSSAERRTSDRIRVPADVERPDRILAGLTARQLAILAVAAVALWGGYVATRRLVPVGAFAAVALPVAAVAALLALGRLEGVSADRFVLAAWRHLHTSRRFVPAPDGVPAPPEVLAPLAGAPPAPLRLGFIDVAGDGTIDLGADGYALVCRASPVTFSLRTPAEQEALVAAFGRFWNSLAEPVEIVVRAEPVKLQALVDELVAAAPGLPHPALEAAAREHAQFLAELEATRTLLRREVLVVLRQPVRTGDAERLGRRAHEAAAALGAAGVALSVLDRPAAVDLLSRAMGLATTAGGHAMNDGPVALAVGAAT